mgnify:CR=1 FL=1
MENCEQLLNEYYSKYSSNCTIETRNKITKITNIFSDLEWTILSPKGDGLWFSCEI